MPNDPLCHRACRGLEAGRRAVRGEDAQLALRVASDDQPAREREPRHGSVDDRARNLLGCSRGVDSAHHVEQGVASVQVQLTGMLQVVQACRERPIVVQRGSRALCAPCTPSVGCHHRDDP